MTTVAEGLLVIIPAKDEEEALGAVLKELYDTLEGAHVVVVDDGSTDRTGEVARTGGAVVLRMPFNLGIGGALRAGFRYAVDHGFERAVQFDADGQHDPAEIATLLSALDDGAELVIGSRFTSEETDYQVSRIRGRAMGLLRVTVRSFTGRSFTDTSSGFRGFSRTTLALFASEYPSEYMESVEALLMACAHGLDVREVPVRMRTRGAGQPSNRRLRLAYHFVRVFLVIAVSNKRRDRRDHKEHQ